MERRLPDDDDDFVRCLACGTTYRLPAYRQSPDDPRGCPECAYVGWIAVSLPIRPRSDLRRPQG